MTTARRQLIDADTTPYYHIISRCVRRAFLCGQDKQTGQDFSHRRQWIEDKLFDMAKIFAIDIAAYAVMNNHYHLVLHIDTQLALAWSAEELCKQYAKLHVCCPLVQRYIDGTQLSAAEISIVQGTIQTYRERLMSISWFMRSLNQSIARQANIEDNVTGRFWEGRFKSQALLDDAALVTCMAYVDLNPIRANLTTTPEKSDFTSIQTRLDRNTRQPTNAKANLFDFIKPKPDYGDKGIPLSETAYIELVDWTGRCMRNDKRGYIPSHLPPILERLNLNEHEWLRHTKYFESRYKRVAGTWEVIKRVAKKLGKTCFHGKPPKAIPD